MYYVYFIESLISKWVYVGFTEDLGRRLSEHNSGKVRSTKFRRPYKLIYFEEFKLKSEARVSELSIKKNARLKLDILESISF